ncbi:outer membrane beta-barrel protein [Lewinella sp. JB7]|uniref:outer membrane beta-barrel protein n=1 Tax=Lewinella sp. JB7 TaxID=2962887 RepID=UPI0020CA0B98|nr:outer membrane beta-barrel protein [Lewinella sp. JB7]MCP9234979.1 outer membrane beta-barrel protein [Lewinella sp. JB7]
MKRSCTPPGLCGPLPMLLVFLALLSVPVSAQSPLDVGGHISPQLRYISSADRGVEVPTTGSFTSGKDGLSLGIGAGVYLEYAITPNWFVRGGVDLSYKRNQYGVRKTFVESDSTISGTNQIVYSSIELPLSVLYRFDFLPNGDSFLLGIGTTVNRWGGNPRAFASFFHRRGVKEFVDYPRHTVTVFGGYERYLSNVIVVGLEPYLSYVPTRFNLETTTSAKVQVEAGLSLRFHLDN